MIRRELVWITVNALKKGKIQRAYIPKSEFDKARKEGTVCYSSLDILTTSDYVSGAQWHRTKEEAIADADRRRLKKIERLEKEIERLKAMDFSVES